MIFILDELTTCLFLLASFFFNNLKNNIQINWRCIFESSLQSQLETKEKLFTKSKKTISLKKKFQKISAKLYKNEIKTNTGIFLWNCIQNSISSILNNSCVAKKFTWACFVKKYLSNHKRSFLDNCFIYRTICLLCSKTIYLKNFSEFFKLSYNVDYWAQKNTRSSLLTIHTIHENTKTIKHFCIFCRKKTQINQKIYTENIQAGLYFSAYSFVKSDDLFYLPVVFRFADNEANSKLIKIHRHKEICAFFFRKFSLKVKTYILSFSFTWMMFYPNLNDNQKRNTYSTPYSFFLKTANKTKIGLFEIKTSFYKSKIKFAKKKLFNVIKGLKSHSKYLAKPLFMNFCKLDIYLYREV